MTRLFHVSCVESSPLLYELHASHRAAVLSGTDLRDMAVTGLRIYSMGDEYYFVSPALKAELEKGAFPYLRFSEGLSEFAGA